MTAKKILAILLGLLIIVGGFYCTVTPGLTYLSLAWLAGFVILFDSVGVLSSWSDMKKLGHSNGWTLAGAIVSLIFGLALIFSIKLQIVTSAFMTYLIAFWIIMAGCIRLAAAMKLRRYKKETGVSLPGLAWGWVLILGILMLIAGVLSLINPLALAVAIGFMVGISIIVAGANLIAFALMV